MSSTASLPEVRRRKPALRVVYYSLCVLLFLLIAAVWWLYWMAHSPLPQLDGSIAVPGISSKVRVVRDERGVPTIEAATLEDLFFAQGYVTAQDRLWQMDMIRRAAAGELSEVIGEDTVKMDREQRILGLRQGAEAAEKNISARDRVYFEAYARGVNTFVESHRDRLSLEFRLMKYNPRPWTVTDSLLVGARMVQDLNHYSYARALEREKILAKLGPELTSDLYVNFSWRDRPPTEIRRMDEEPAADSDDDDDDEEEVDPEGGAGRMTSNTPPNVPQGITSSRKKSLRTLAATSGAKARTHFKRLNGTSGTPALPKTSAKEIFPQAVKSRFVSPFKGTAQQLAEKPRPCGESFPQALKAQHVFSELAARLNVVPSPEPGDRAFSASCQSLASPPTDETQADLFRPGSNDWVVSGQHTVSGKPLLSNDMHLDHQMPNLWFEAHLRMKDGSFDVAGVTLPGIPFVIVGHNQRIGWGFTNVGPTVEDDFIEEFNAQGQYKTPAGWVEPQHRLETIHVKGKPDVTLDVLTTRHGPIITELIPGETRKIALRWTLQDGEGLVFFDVDTARDWQEFRKAFSAFYAPGQNVMYADVDGHIGYQATGRVPIRASGDGSLPVNGSDDAHEWKNWIPFDEMPHVYDPPSGILATANGRIAPDGYKYSISTEWDAPWRTDRIYRVLESGKKFAPADMLSLQMDISSTYDRFCADKFVYAIDHAAKASNRAKRAGEILRDWDGRMSADSAAPTIETKARQELARLLLEPKLGAPSADPNRGQLSWKSYRWGMSSVWLENVLTRQPVRWLPPGYSDYGSLLTAAVENVVRRSKSFVDNPAADRSVAPSDLNQWKWGGNYSVEINHLVLGQLPLVGRFSGTGLHPLSGSGYTVKAVSSVHGASERATWEFSNFDQSTLNLVTGESGIFLSPYYMDQWKAWYRGSTFGFPFSAGAVEQHRKHEMTLTPR